ncbi:MAG: mannose-1-phosphate guanylyltransferase [Treponema sp.]|jgi:mannose-1-phosphate guanylyltransferase/mannose-1-phosphate guanylyltransferase/mannose-6-phosphate isomerase|nr:mannose-1-phosphate guanylyltransferase [Treponema sp.]
MFDDCIIMAGGSGVRLWPASSSRRPKQFLPIPGGEGSFFDASVERALAAVNRQGRVIIIAGFSHTARIAAACEKYAPEDRSRLVLIPEPEAKNTAPAIACAVRFIVLSSGKDRNVLVLTSDHIIDPLESFLADAVAAADASAGADRLTVFGIRPRGPETGYGYIEAESPLSGAEENPGIFAVRAFREKPGLEQAETFLKAGNFFWNSGMFAFSSRFILEEFHRCAPAVIRPFNILRPPEEGSFGTEGNLRVLRDWDRLAEAYRETPAVSFDYAIAEQCSRTVMVRACFGWTDVGSWDEYAALINKHGQETAETFRYNAANCFVDSDIPAALIGVEDLIVAVRSGKNGEPGSVLISKKGQSQQVRAIVDLIRKKGRGDLL